MTRDYQAMQRMELLEALRSKEKPSLFQRVTRSSTANLRARLAYHDSPEADKAHPLPQWVVGCVFAASALLLIVPAGASAAALGYDTTYYYGADGVPVSTPPCKVWRQGDPVTQYGGANTRGYCASIPDAIQRIYELEQAVNALQQQLANQNAGAAGVVPSRMDALEARVGVLEGLVRSIQQSLVMVVNLLSDAINKYAGR